MIHAPFEETVGTPIQAVAARGVADGTPLLDTKPYVPAFDDREGTRIGRFQGKTNRVHEARADDRLR